VRLRKREACSKADYSENGVSDKGKIMLITNPSHWARHRLAVGLLWFAVGFGLAHLVRAREPGLQTQKILDTSHSVVGEVIRYPHSGLHPRGQRAEITAQVITLQPGAATSWHSHPMPTFGYIISGEIEVDYGAKGQKTFREGDALMEAMGHVHRGRNVSQKPVRVLAVSIGEQGQPTAVEASQPGNH